MLLIVLEETKLNVLGFFRPTQLFEEEMQQEIFF